MKVLLVNKFNWLKGGADKYFLDLADLLQANNIEVAKFCMKHPNNLPSKYDHYFVSNIDFNKRSLWQMLRYVGRILYSFEAKRKFAQLLKEFQPDIIHIHNIYHQISPSILTVAKQHHIPVVMHVHDYKLVCPNYKMFCQGQICERCKHHKFYNCLLHRCFKQSFIRSLLVTIEMYWHHSILHIYEKNIDHYICPSQFMADKLVEWGVAKDKLQTILHYIDTNKYQANFDLGNYFLFFGRLDKEKGVDILVKAVAQVPEAKLKIVGFGPEHKTIKELISQHKLENRVDIVGPKYGDELKEIIQKAYAVVVPSLWYEVFGLVILEAAALGKVTIVAKIGGMPEAVQDQKTALLFQPGSVEDLVDKINWAVHNPQDMAQMAQQARHYMEEAFTPGKHLAQILGVYQKLKQ